VPQPVVIAIDAVPADATYTLDGAPLDTAEVKLAPHDGLEHELQACKQQGYFCVTSILTTKSPTKLHVELPADGSWNETVPCDKVNAALEFSREGTPEEVWSELQTLLTAQVGPLEVRDAHFLRTAWKVGGAEGDPRRIQSRVTVTLVAVDGETVSTSVTVEAEAVSADGRTAPIARTFPVLVELLRTLETLK